LILNGSNSTLGSPIDGVREVSDGRRDGVGSNVFSVGFKESTSGVLGLEFSGSQISELVKGVFSRIVFSIESGDLEDVFDEDTISDDFFSIGVGLLVLSLPSRPEVGIRVSLNGGGETDDGKKQNEFVHC